MSIFDVQFIDKKYRLYTYMNDELKGIIYNIRSVKIERQFIILTYIHCTVNSTKFMVISKEVGDKSEYATFIALRLDIHEKEWTDTCRSDVWKCRGGGSLCPVCESVCDSVAKKL